MLPDPNPTLPVPDVALPRIESVAEADQFKDPRHQEAFKLLNLKLRGKETRSPRRKITIFVITLVLFMTWLAWRAADSGAVALTRGALIVGVLLLHELGHFLAMKHFGYRDVSMFFIPFFGAAVSGKKADVKPWQEVLMILAGPLPGILIGVPLLLVSTKEQFWLQEAAVLLILINGINLLPIKPLDGGRFFEIVLFCRWRWTLTLFGLLSLIGFAVFLIQVVELSPIAVLILTVFQASTAWRRRKMRIKLREREVPMELQPDGGVMAGQALGLFRTIEDVFAPHQVSAANLAEIARHHLQEQQQKPAGVAASLGLLAVYFAALLLMAAGVIGFWLQDPVLSPRIRQLWSRVLNSPDS